MRKSQINLGVSIQYTSVRDGETDIGRRLVPRFRIASRGKMRGLTRTSDERQRQVKTIHAAHFIPTSADTLTTDSANSRQSIYQVSCPPEANNLHDVEM